MKTLLSKIGINIDDDEPSTKKGIALIGSGAALAMGHQPASRSPVCNMAA